MREADTNDMKIQKWYQLLFSLQDLPVTEFDFERDSDEWVPMLKAYDRMNCNADRESGILGLPKCYKENGVTDSTLDSTDLDLKSPMPANVEEYIAMFKFDEPIDDLRMIAQVLASLRRIILEAPSFVEDALCIRSVYDIKLITYDRRCGIGVLWFKAETGTFVNRLCVCIGFLLGVEVQVIQVIKNKVYSPLVSKI